MTIQDDVLDLDVADRLPTHVTENGVGADEKPNGAGEVINRDWGAGYGDRFGLAYVDPATQRRIPKISAHRYARMIRAEAMEAAR